MPHAPPPGVHPEAASRAVALAASRGGVHALRVVLAGLPAGFPGALLVVLHCPPDRRSRLAEALAPHLALPVRDARAGEPARAGTVLLAPSARHLTIRPDRTLSLDRDAPVHFTRPAADPLLASLALAYGPAGAAAVLTGGGADGAAGAAALRRAGGLVLAQRPDGAHAPGMPSSAIAAGVVHEVLALDDIASALLRFVLPPASPPP